MLPFAIRTGVLWTVHVGVAVENIAGHNPAQRRPPVPTPVERFSPASKFRSGIGIRFWKLLQVAIGQKHRRGPHATVEGWLCRCHVLHTPVVALLHTPVVAALHTLMADTSQPLLNHTKIGERRRQSVHTCDCRRQNARPVNGHVLRCTVRKFRTPKLQP